MNADHLRMYVIRPVLKDVDLWSQEAENLLLGTAAQESHMGQYLRQVGGGPAKGIYQMEPATHDDIWENYLAYKPQLAANVHRYLAGFRPSTDQLVWNLGYATLMCRAHYFRVSDPLPVASDVEGLAAYWKQHYNTFRGAGTEREFIENYRRLI